MTNNTFNTQLIELAKTLNGLAEKGFDREFLTGLETLSPSDCELVKAAVGQLLSTSDHNSSICSKSIRLIFHDEQVKLINLLTHKLSCDTVKEFVWACIKGMAWMVKEKEQSRMICSLSEDKTEIKELLFDRLEEMTPNVLSRDQLKQRIVIIQKENITDHETVDPAVSDETPPVEES